MENKNVICHIVGLNPLSKKLFINKLDNKKFEFIDLDNINDEIFKNPDMDKMFKKYQSLKKSKNEKYKDLEKKMTEFWEKNFINLIENNIPGKKKAILIGNNNHYRQLSKKITLPTTNKFIIKSNDKQDIRELIEYNLKTHKRDIINGCFPINYLSFDYLMKRKKIVEESYLKCGYLEKTVPQMIQILKLLGDKKIKGEGLFISLREQYNNNTKIFPKKNGKVFAYSEPVLALLGSFKFKDDELVKDYDENRVKIVEKKKNILNKMKKKRYLYLVEKDTFIPHEKGKNVKFFSQAPVLILDSEEIKNVYTMMKEIGAF